MTPLPHRNELLARVKKAARYCREASIRKKILLFLKVLELGVLKACEEEKIYPPFYYYWWKRYLNSGFKIEALKEKTRGPKKPSRKTDPKVVDWIRRYRKTNEGSLETIQLELMRHQKVRISKSTLYRIHLREGLPIKKRKSPISKGVPSPSLREEGKGIIVSTERPIFADRYRLEKELGRGGGGIVFLAEDRKAENRKVALKRVQWTNQQNSKMIESFKNEFATLAVLRHPNLAPVFDFGQTDREIYFTSEYIAGKDILTVAREANLNTVFQLLVQTLAALDFLHRRGVLHLDLKPENILVTDPGRAGELTVKLIDFGTAQWPKKGNALEGEFVGTPPYASPEIIRGEPPTSSCDLYSLGMIFHRIFAGRFPFEKAEPFEMMKEQLYGEPLKMTEIHPALPEEFSDLLRKMVAREPRDRFQSVPEIVSALNECLGENFSLRGKSAPARIVEDSDFLFRKETLETLVQTFARKGGRVTVLSGPEGSGKSRLVKHLKEKLQLGGIHPLLVEKKEALEDLLKGGKESCTGPLLIDGPELTEEEMVSRLDLLENLPYPVLLTTSLSPTLQLNPSEWIELSPLTTEAVSQFLDHEILDFPSRSIPSLAEMSGGLPASLEKLLQAIREEEWLQWSDQGWQWAGEEESFDLAELLSRSKTRWEGRRLEVAEILKFSRLSLSGNTLEGILGLEDGVLHDKWKEWEGSGWIASKKIKTIPHYYSPEGFSPEKRTARPSLEWSWAEKELESLYQQGAFSRGVELARLIEEGLKKKEEAPERVLLLCARHWVALGYSEESLKALPEEAPKEGSDRGLFYEIRARAHFGLGRIDSATADLHQAEKAYHLRYDGVGLSRVYNLMGQLSRRVHDLKSAEDAYEKSIAAARDVNDAYHQGIAQMNLAIFYQDQGQFSRAQEIYEATFPLEKRANQPLLSCKLKDNWVNLLYYTGRSAEAEAACYDLLKTALRCRYVDQQAAAFRYLALLSGQKSHWDLQLTYLNRALSLLNPKPNRPLYLQTLLDRGYLFCGLRKFIPSQLDAESALDLATRRSDTNYISIASLLLGKIFRDRPRPDLTAATEYLNTAHRLIYQNRLRQILWEVEFDRGLLAKKKGEMLRARNYFLSAQKELNTFLEELPETMRQNFLRDRKRERIAEELKGLGD